MTDFFLTIAPIAIAVGLCLYFILYWRAYPKNKVFTCSKHNYTGINNPCPDCEKELESVRGEEDNED